MQPNLNGAFTGLERVTPPLPKGNLFPKSLLWNISGLQRLKEARRIIFISGKCHFIFTLLTLEKPSFFFYQNFQKCFPPPQVEHGVSLPSFSPLKMPAAPGSSRSPGLPRQLWGILGGKRTLSWERCLTEATAGAAGTPPRGG